MASITKRGKTWYLQYSDADGKHIRKSLKTGDRREAERILAKIQIHLVREEFDLLPKKKEERLVYDFLNFQIRNIWTHKFPSTAQSETKRLEQLRDYLAKERIQYMSQVRKEHIEGFMLQRARTCAVKTLNEQLRVIKRAFQDAVENGLIQKNPAREILRYRRADRDAHELFYWEVEEVNRLAREAETECDRDTFLLLCNTGMRLGEVMHLEWRDIRFEDKSICIRSKPEQNWWVKSRQARRIPMNDVALDILMRMDKKRIDGFVVYDPVIRKHGNFWHRIKKMKMAAGIAKGNVHCTRHTFASHLLMNGEDLAKVCELLGHANIRTTMIYAHLAPARLHEAVRRINLGSSVLKPHNNLIPLQKIA